MTMSAPTLEKILQAVNEKYGTSFEGWSQLPAVYEVGDTVPNWNAYEKIEMTKSQKIAIGFNRNIAFSFGEIRNDIFFIIVNSESQGIWAKDDGEVVSYSGPNDEAKSYLIETLSNKGINISDVINEISNLQIGEIVGDWSEYEKILQ